MRSWARMAFGDRKLIASLSSREWRNWQTRWLQVPVLERAWGFKSPLAHNGLIAELVELVCKTLSERRKPPRNRGPSLFRTAVESSGRCNGWRLARLEPSIERRASFLARRNPSVLLSAVRCWAAKSLRPECQDPGAAACSRPRGRCGLSEPCVWHAPQSCVRDVRPAARLSLGAAPRARKCRSFEGFQLP